MSAQSIKGVPEALSALGNATKRAKGNRSAPEVVKARNELAEAKLARHIEQTVAEAPELSPEVRARLAALLTQSGASS